MTFSILFTSSLSVQIHTASEVCFWTQPCSHTTPLGNLFSFIFGAAGFAKTPYVLMVTCIVDKGTHWQPPPPPPSVNNPHSPPPPLSISLLIHYHVLWWCFTFFVSASVLYLLVLPTSLFFGGCPMIWITKLACWLNNAIKTQCRCGLCGSEQRKT